LAAYLVDEHEPRRDHHLAKVLDVDALKEPTSDKKHNRGTRDV
jgi:hypothetical protein